MLSQLLAGHRPEDDKEAEDLEVMREALGWAAPLSRSHWPGHFTGSAVVVDPDGARVCLVHHRRLGRWLQPGGHVEPGDGQQLAATALREAREETGLAVELHPRAPAPLDVDVHVIPARKEEPEHRHLDVRFLVVAPRPDELTHDATEVHGARWLSWDEAVAAADEPAFRRMLEKARRAAPWTGVWRGGKSVRPG